MQQSQCLQQDFESLARTKQRDRADRPRRFISAARRPGLAEGNAVGNDEHAIAKSLPTTKPIAQTLRHGNQGRRPAHRKVLHDRPGQVSPTIGRFPHRRTMDVVHQRHARSGCRQGPDQRRPGRVGMDQIAAIPANQLHQRPRRAEVEPPAHRRRKQQGMARAVHFRKSLRFDAGKGRLKAELRQSRGQQVLNPFGARIVLAVDHMQYATQSRRTFHGSGAGRLSRARDERLPRHEISFSSTLRHFGVR